MIVSGSKHSTKVRPPHGANLPFSAANGRDSSSNPSYYVFNNCDIAAAPGSSVPNGAFYLGRPWRNYSRVVFQRTSMSAVINPAGWSVWNKNASQTEHVSYTEYANTGAGASGSRASFASKLSGPVAITDILGKSYASQAWYDASYM